MEPTKESKVVEVKTEEDFSRFIQTYAMSFGANHFLSAMEPAQRVTFFVTVSKTYPDEWKTAIAQLTEEQEPVTSGR